MSEIYVFKKDDLNHIEVNKINLIKKGKNFALESKESLILELKKNETLECITFSMLDEEIKYLNDCQFYHSFNKNNWHLLDTKIYEDTLSDMGGG